MATCTWHRGSRNTLDETNKLVVLCPHLYAATHTVFVELTLGNLGEDLVHWVPVPTNSSQLHVANIMNDPAAVVDESPLQEDIGYSHLDEQVEKVEDLHKEEGDGVGVVLPLQLVVTLFESKDERLVVLILNCYILLYQSAVLLLNVQSWLFHPFKTIL